MGRWASKSICFSGRFLDPRAERCTGQRGVSDTGVPAPHLLLCQTPAVKCLTRARVVIPEWKRIYV